MPQSLSIPPENVRKPLMFLTFLGGIERGQWHKMSSKEVYNTCLENKKEGRTLSVIIKTNFYLTLTPFLLASPSPLGKKICSSSSSR